MKTAVGVHDISLGSNIYYDINIRKYYKDSANNHINMET